MGTRAGLGLALKRRGPAAGRRGGPGPGGRFARSLPGRAESSGRRGPRGEILGGFRWPPLSVPTPWLAGSVPGAWLWEPRPRNPGLPLEQPAGRRALVAFFEDIRLEIGYSPKGRAPLSLSGPGVPAAPGQPRGLWANGAEVRGRYRLGVRDFVLDLCIWRTSWLVTSPERFKLEKPNNPVTKKINLFGHGGG